MFLQIRKVLLHDFGNRSAGVRSAEHIRKSFDEVMISSTVWRVCSVRRNPQCFQGVYRLEAVELLGHQHDIGMKTGDLFQTRVDSAAHLWFFLGIRG